LLSSMDTMPLGRRGLATFQVKGGRRAVFSMFRLIVVRDVRGCQLRTTHQGYAPEAPLPYRCPRFFLSCCLAALPAASECSAQSHGQLPA
jgi:hypothetical protein